MRLLNNLENSFLLHTVYDASFARARCRNTRILSCYKARFPMVPNVSKDHTGVKQSHSNDSAPLSHEDFNEAGISLTVHVRSSFLGYRPHKSCTDNQVRNKQINRITDSSISQQSSWCTTFPLSKELIKLRKV